MFNHQAINPMGAKFYHLGAGYQATTNNRYQSINGIMIKRKLTEQEQRSPKLLALRRSISINADGKSTGMDFSINTQINLLLQSYVAGRVGSAFLIRTLRYLAEQSPASRAQGIIDMIHRNMKLELRRLQAKH
ncbi:hypothetical protein REH81_05180 [Vibrio rotiferianus]